MEAQNAQGLMFRFTTYLTYYDRNGIFNDYPPVNTRSNSLKALEALHGIYQAGLDNVADIVLNPAYSRTAGVLGLWFADEYPTAPAGRRLEPVGKFPIPGGNPKATIQLGVISAQAQGDLLSLDLGTGFPFAPCRTAKTRYRSARSCNWVISKSASSRTASSSPWPT